MLPHLFPRQDTELVVGLPSSIAPAAQVRGFLKTEGAPPPPPADGGELLGRGEGRSFLASRRHVSGAGPEGKREKDGQSFSGLQVFDWEAMNAAFQGHQ